MYVDVALGGCPVQSEDTTPVNLDNGQLRVAWSDKVMMCVNASGGNIGDGSDLDLQQQNRNIRSLESIIRVRIHIVAERANYPISELEFLGTVQDLAESMSIQQKVDAPILIA
jgi:hypothetical protein